MKLEIKKLDSIVERLVTPRAVIAGKARTMKSHCGKAGCKCMRKNNPEKHSYNQLSYTKDKKTRTMYVKDVDLESVQNMSANYNELRTASLDLGHEAVLLAKAHGVNSACEIMIDSFERVKRKSIGLKPESQLLKETRITKEKWKTKAFQRQAILDAKSVRIRDLEKSRKSWKQKAFNAQKHIKIVQKKLDGSTKQLEEIEKNNDIKKNY